MVSGDGFSISDRDKSLSMVEMVAQRKTNGSNNQIGLGFDIRENFEGGLRDALAERESIKQKAQSRRKTLFLGNSEKKKRRKNKYTKWKRRPYSNNRTLPFVKVR